MGASVVDVTRNKGAIHEALLALEFFVTFVIQSIVDFPSIGALIGSTAGAVVSC